MRPLIRFVLLTALRDKLFLGLISLLLVSGYIASVMGSTALLETKEATVVYAAGATRAVLVVGVVVFVGFHLRSCFDNREIELFLSRPVSRVRLVLAFWIGFALVSCLLAMPVIAGVAWLGPLHWGGFVLWALSLLAEMLIVVSMALFASLMLPSAVTSVTTSLALYTLGRLMGYFIATTKSGLLFHTTLVNMVTTWSLTFVSAFIPRLDFFAKTDWLIYGSPNLPQEWFLMLAQSASAVALLLALAMLDFLRRKF